MIEKILGHCGLCLPAATAAVQAGDDPSARAPPSTAVAVEG
jgi:hypothetical protein